MNMNIDTAHLRKHVINPTLEYLHMYSCDASQLLEAVADHESACNPFSDTCQGLGIYQISSEQHRNVWDKYLAFQPDLASLVRGLASQRHFLEDPDSELITNLRYSTAIAWMMVLQSENQGKKSDQPLLNPYWQKLYDESHHHIEQLAVAV